MITISKGDSQIFKCPPSLQLIYLFIHILYKLENAHWWKRVVTKYIFKSTFVLLTILSLSFVPIIIVFLYILLKPVVVLTLQYNIQHLTFLCHSRDFDSVNILV